MASKPTATRGVAITIIGGLMVLAAGAITFVEHVSALKGPPCAVRAPATTADQPQVISVQSGRDPDGAEIQLGRPICVAVAGLRSSAELAERDAAAKAAAKDVKAANDALVRAHRETESARAAKDDAKLKQAQTTEAQAKAAADDLNARDTAAKAALEAATQPIELALYLSDREMPARTIFRAVPEAQAKSFTLPRNEDANSDEAKSMRGLLGGVLGGATHDVTVGVGVPGSKLPLATWNPVKPASRAKLLVYYPAAAWLAGFGFILLFVGLFVWSATTGLLRDGDASSTYSLGRVQMAFWMVATIFGFAFIWVLTGQYRNVITQASFTLLGITGATALAARASDGNASKTSKHFLTDITSDGTSEPKLHRLQIIIWTLVLGVIYLWTILDQLILTNFDANLLILIGIASGVYAGLKTQEA